MRVASETRPGIWDEMVLNGGRVRVEQKGGGAHAMRRVEEGEDGGGKDGGEGRDIYVGWRVVI